MPPIPREDMYPHDDPSSTLNGGGSTDDGNDGGGGSGDGSGLHRRTPSELEWELNKLRESTREALRASWAEAERLQAEAQETEERAAELQRRVDLLRAEKEAANAAASVGPLPELSAEPGADDGTAVLRAAAIAARAAAAGDDESGRGDGEESGEEDGPYLGWGGGGGAGGLDDDDDDDDGLSDDDDDSLDSADLAEIQRTAGLAAAPTAKQLLSQASSHDASAAAAAPPPSGGAARQVSWGEQLGSSIRRASGMINRNSDDDLVAAAAGPDRRRSSALSLSNHGGGGSRRPSALTDDPIDEELEADLGLLDGSDPRLASTEEALMAQLAALQNSTAVETLALEAQIAERESNIASLETATRNQEQSIKMLRSEFDCIREAMAREAQVQECELDALRGQAEQMRRQDVELDAELEVAEGRARAERDGLGGGRLEEELRGVREDVDRMRAVIGRGGAVGGAGPEAHGGSAPPPRRQEAEENGDDDGCDDIDDDVSALTLDTALWTVAGPPAGGSSRRK